MLARLTTPLLFMIIENWLVPVWGAIWARPASHKMVFVLQTPLCHLGYPQSLSRQWAKLQRSP